MSFIISRQACYLCIICFNVYNILTITGYSTSSRPQRRKFLCSSWSSKQVLPSFDVFGYNKSMQYQRKIIQSAFLKLWNSIYFSGVFILSVIVLKKSVSMKHFLFSNSKLSKMIYWAKIPKLVLKSVLKLNNNFCPKNRWTDCIPTCSALELFLIKRKIKGPNWLQVSNFSTCSASQRVRFYYPHLLWVTYMI